MKKYIFTETQLRKIIDSQIKESQEKKEFRPGVNLGKYDLKSLLDKDEKKDEDKEEDPKKPFSANKLKTDKEKKD